MASAEPEVNACAPWADVTKAAAKSRFFRKWMVIFELLFKLIIGLGSVGGNHTETSEHR